MNAAEPIVLPPAASEPRRPSLPFLAAIVPVASGVLLWAVTGSVLALCFAALGPLMLLASFADGARQRRRERKKFDTDAKEQRARAESTLRERHNVERENVVRAYPDVAACVQEPPLRRAQVDSRAVVTVGRGARASEVQVIGGDGDWAQAFRKRARTLGDAPLTVPVATGLCIRAPEPLAAAIARALVLQLCMRHSVRSLAVMGDAVEALGLASLPHARAMRRDAWRLNVSSGEETDVHADSRIILLAPQASIPPGFGSVLDVTDPTLSTLRTAEGTRQCDFEGVSLSQAMALIGSLAEREEIASEPPSTLSLSELLEDDLDEPTSASSRRSLTVAIGQGASAATVLDLVDDGPHAIVTGVTGSGKSELLVSWITALAARYSVDDVVFVLADFKGGTAFDGLRDLPHVAAVITDLDAESALRGVQSLRAELRRRERELAAVDARNIADPVVKMPRLVIVVDEFAALLQEHPELASVFTDIAARGRALGMHLILGTQRAAGVIRDALASNCPLRVTLRVTETSDSRLVIGSDDAAALPGDASGRGLALLRRPQDTSPQLFRVALTHARDIRNTALARSGEQRATSPWHPDLPLAITPAEAVACFDDSRNGAGGIVLGVVDDPTHQSQSVLRVLPGTDRGLLVVGGAGSGKSTLVQTLLAQEPSALIVPEDPEAAWTIVTHLAAGTHPAPSMLICDDLDARVAAFPPEYAAEWLAAWEQIARAAGSRGTTLVVTTSRLSGPIAQLASLIPRRVLLQVASKADHLALGADSVSYNPHRAPGRGRMDDLEVQFAQADAVDRSATQTSALAVTPRWVPSAALNAVVASRPGALLIALKSAHPGARVIPLDEVSTELVASCENESVPTIIIGDGESWQRQWTLWQRARADGAVVVLSECTRELRTLAGVRELPPYATANAGRAWILQGGAEAQRVRLLA